MMANNLRHAVRFIPVHLPCVFGAIAILQLPL
jgi:hypothetical protein